jgi:uncharacterized protein YgiM (DUF1202 family)
MTGPMHPTHGAMLRLLWPLITLVALCVGTARAQTMVSVDRPLINMRDGAGTRHTAIWQLAKGYPLKVVAKRGGWLKVRDFENDTGWVLGRLTGRKPHVVVKVPVANLRSRPSTRTRVAGRVEYGEVLRTLERRSGWVKVRQEGGRTGWIARRLVWGW